MSGPKKIKFTRLWCENAATLEGDSEVTVGFTACWRLGIMGRCRKPRGHDGDCAGVHSEEDAGDCSHQHRWSGWPGATCMYCGIEDERESNPDSLITCDVCYGVKEAAEFCDDCKGTGCMRNPKVKNPPCPHYDGSDPYKRPWPPTDGSAIPAVK